MPGLARPGIGHAARLYFPGRPCGTLWCRIPLAAYAAKTKRLASCCSWLATGALGLLQLVGHRRPEPAPGQASLRYAPPRRTGLRPGAYNNERHRCAGAPVRTLPAA